MGLPPEGSRVVVVGAGRAGFTSIQYLAMLGLGSLGIVDDRPVSDADVEPRGVLPETAVGLPRARAAAQWARAIPGVGEVRVHPVRLDEATADLLDGYDTIVDASESLATARFLADQSALRRMPVVAPDLGLTPAPVATITAEALEARLAARARGLDAFTLLDVRERPERDVEAIEGSVAAEGFGSTSAVRPTIDPDSPVVVVCARGNRAQWAARILRARGVDVSMLERGMLGWNLRPSALAGGVGDRTGRVPLPLGDIDPEGFRPNLHG